jgi:type I restriction enzyme R subunit
MTSFAESVVEQAALAWLESLGYAILHGPDIAPGEPFAERDDYGQVVLAGRLRQALQRLNPQAPRDALDEAFRRLTRPDSPSLVANNHAVHRYLVEGVPVEYQRADGTFRGDLIRVLDHDDADNNDFLAVNQFTAVEDRRERRPDVVLFINGLPLAVVELKNPADERADIGQAFNQLQTYKQQIPSLFTYNAALLVSDGVLARLGTLTADREWFLPWRTVTGEDLAAISSSLKMPAAGCCSKRWPATTSTMPSTSPSKRRCVPANPARRCGASAKSGAPTWPGQRATPSPATAASVWCGTPRARARA